jgi:Domain of unknown function (DUF4402)
MSNGITDSEYPMRLFPVFVLTTLPLMAAANSVSSSAMVSVRILRPIGISKIQDLHASILSPHAAKIQIHMDKDKGVESTGASDLELSHSVLLPNHAELKNEKGESLEITKIEVLDLETKVSVGGVLQVREGQSAGNYKGDCDVAVAYE